MDLSYPIKWTLVNRAVAILALLAGLALVAMGFVAGFGSAVTNLVADPLNPGPAIEQANPTVTLVFCLLGLIVWQFGKTYALFLTLPRASGRAAARRVDGDRLAADVADRLEDRLAAIERDVAETRREVERLKRDSHTASYDERDALEDGDSAPDGDSVRGGDSSERQYVPRSPSSGDADGDPATDAEPTRDGSA